VVSGSWPGEIYLFLRQQDGTFARPEKISDGSGQPIRVGRATAVSAVDWDLDGDTDLVVGTLEGQIYFIPNDGTSQKRRFGTPKELKSGDDPIKIPDGDAGPCVADWDGDGKADLIVGTGSGKVLWYRNRGTRFLPLLDQPKTLVPAAAGRNGEYPGRRTKVSVNDWNEDGRPDLLVGDLQVDRQGGRGLHGNVWLFLRNDSGSESAPSQVDVRKP